MQGQDEACSALFKGVFKGVYAVPWDLPADEPPSPGLMWRWQGEALRLDGGAPALWLARPLARPDIRPRARARLRRVAFARPRPAPEAGPVAAPPRGGVVFTDGRQLFPARLVASAGRRVLVFDPFLPPPDTDLWVVAADADRAPLAPSRPGGLPAGTLVPTPDGLCPAEALAPGAQVLTRDQGAQPLLWVGQTRLGGAEMALYPQLRPVVLRPGALGPGRPKAPLRLAPGQLLARPGRGLRPGGEVLVAAADLIDGRSIRTALGAGPVTYVHLLLPRHDLIDLPEGVTVASFHPALADPVALRWHAKGLERALPGLTRDPWRYGAPALPCLDPARAAMLAAA
jgi:hypothetical protein